MFSFSELVLGLLATTEVHTTKYQLYINNLSSLFLFCQIGQLRHEKLYFQLPSFLNQKLPCQLIHWKERLKTQKNHKNWQMKQRGIIRQQRTENRSKVINTKRGRKRDIWSKSERTKPNSQDDRFKPRHTNKHTKHQWSEYIGKQVDIVKLDFFPKRLNYMIPKKKKILFKYKNTIVSQGNINKSKNKQVEPNQTYKLLYSKGNNKQNRQPTEGENICKCFNQQKLKLQNTQIVHTT